MVCTCVGWVDKQNNALFSRTQQNEALLFFSKSSWNLHLTKPPLNPHRSGGALVGGNPGDTPVLSSWKVPWEGGSGGPALCVTWREEGEKGGSQEVKGKRMGQGKSSAEAKEGTARRGGQ